MRIYIPTFKRVDKQLTLEHLPKELLGDVILVIQNQEEKLYDKYDVQKLVVGNDIGIAKTRELIYRHAGNNRFGMIDDDIKMHRRNGKYYGQSSNMDMSKRLMTLEDWKYWFKEVNRLFDEGAIHVGHRDIALPPYGEQYYNFKHILGVHWLDGSKLSTFIDEVDWTLAEVGEDLVLTLECLMRGFKNIISDEIIMARWDTAFEEGGCADWRTDVMNNSEMMKIAKAYPFVTALNKYDDMKHIGSIQRFKVDCKEAYESYSSSTLEYFFD